MNKNESGVTIIALAITVVVLVIISGITLSQSSSEDGLINQVANEAIYQNETIRNEEQKIENTIKNQVEDWGFWNV